MPFHGIIWVRIPGHNDLPAINIRPGIFLNIQIILAILLFYSGKRITLARNTRTRKLRYQKTHMDEPFEKKKLFRDCQIQRMGLCPFKHQFPVLSHSNQVNRNQN